MIKTKARETEGSAEDVVGRLCIPLGERVSALTVKNKQKNKQTNNQKQNETKTKKRENRKKRVLAAVIAALEIDAITFKVNMDPNELFMRRLSC